MSYDDIDSPDYNDTNVGGGFVESAAERRERKEAERAAKQPETRWPNVQAAIMENGCWLECEAEGAWVLAILNGSEIRRYSKGKPTLELALDSLEQKLAERKEGK